jgi:AcrR family transcriptional regulator
MARKRSIETEARIAEAATALFCTQGYVDTTMATIASAAGVSVQTLYLRHGSKAAILSAALDVAIAGDAEPTSLTERGFFPRVLAEQDAATAVSIWAHGARNICDRTHRLYDVIRSAAANPEVAQVLDKSRRDRSTGHRIIADVLVTRERYNRDVPVQRAADVLYALGTEDSYLLFVVDRGWTPDEWERWVIDTVSAQLLVSSTVTRRRRSSTLSDGSTAV